MTEWDEILALDWGRLKDAMSSPIVIDGRNALDADSLRSLGFIYEGVGKKPLH